jgi:hypothetical protein
MKKFKEYLSVIISIIAVILIIGYLITTTMIKDIAGYDYSEIMIKTATILCVYLIIDSFIDLIMMVHKKQRSLDDLSIDEQIYDVQDDLEDVIRLLDHHYHKKYVYKVPWRE